MNSVLNPAKMLLKAAFASRYVRAVATLSTGQFIAAAIPILAAPVLGRLYLPVDYGMLGTYMAIANVLGAMSTLQFAQGIIAEKNERRAILLVYVCFLSATAVSLVALVVALATYHYMGESAAYASVRGWMLMLPLTSMAAGATTAIATLANRHQRYGFMARIQVLAVAVTVSMSIFLGLLDYGVHGLFISYFSGQVITIVAHLRLYRLLMPELPKINWAKLVTIARRHRDFPFYTLPSEIVGTINLQLPIFALSAVGAVPLLGSFTRARQLISMPLTLLGSSVGQVFRQRASRDYLEHGTCRPIFKRTFLTLVLIGLPPTIILMVIAPDLFRLFLGRNWGQAGEVARILAPMLFLRLVCSPISTVFYFTGAQKQAFLLMGAGVVLVAIGVLPPVFSDTDPYISIYGFSLAYSIIYLCFLAGSWHFSVRPQ